MIELIFNHEETTGQYTITNYGTSLIVFLNPNIIADRKEWYDSRLLMGVTILC